MVNVASYIANLGKSVAYSAVDRLEKSAPAIAEFKDNNADLFKDVYKSVRDYKLTYSKGVDAFKRSKIYEAGDQYKQSLFEDIKSGNFYNKEREDKIKSKIVGFGGDSSNDEIDLDDSMFDDGDFDFNWDDITDGDKMMSSVISATSESNAHAVSMSVAKSAEYIVENKKISDNIRYSQNQNAFNRFTSQLDSINKNIANMHQLGELVHTQAENSKVFFEETTKLQQEQTGILREILSTIKSIATPAKPEQKKNQKTRFNDLIGAEGTLDIKEYINNIKNNISSEFGAMSSMNNMFGEDSNMLLTFASSPLKFIPEMIVKNSIPKALDKSLERFNNSFSGLFGSLISKINTIADNDDNIIASKIAKIFGVRNSIKSNIDTSKYTKTKVDWNGKSEKALTEVLPAQLSKIISLLSGKSERVYDYEKGKFIEISSIKNEFEKKEQGYVKNATYDMNEEFKKYMDLMTFNSLEERKSLQQDISKFFETMYKSGKFFDVNKLSDDAYIDYGVNSKNFNIIKTMFKNTDYSLQHKINNEILSARDKQNSEMESLEESANSIYNYLYNNFNPDEFIKRDSETNKIKDVKNNLLSKFNIKDIKDNLGRNIFFYLQNIYKELTFIRRAGVNGTNEIQEPIVETDNSIYTPLNKLKFSDVKIPESTANVKSISAKYDQIRRDNQKFDEQEQKRRNKNKDLLNYSEIDDDKDMKNILSSKIESEKYRKMLEDEKNDENKTMIDKLLQAKGITNKYSVLTEKLNTLISKPMDFITKTIDKADKRMYELVYGKEENGKDIKGFLDETILRMKSTFGKFDLFLNEKILDPLKTKLDDMGFTDLKNNLKDKMKNIGDRVKEYLFNDNDGLLSKIKDSTKEIFSNAFSNVKDSLKSAYGPLFGKVKNAFNKENKFNDLDEYNDITEDNVTADGKYTKYSTQNRIDRMLGINQNKNNKNRNYYEDIYNEINNISDPKTKLAYAQANKKALKEQNLWLNDSYIDYAKQRKKIGTFDNKIVNDYLNFDTSENINQNIINKKEKKELKDYYIKNYSEKLSGLTSSDPAILKNLLAEVSKDYTSYEDFESLTLDSIMDIVKNKKFKGNKTFENTLSQLKKYNSEVNKNEKLSIEDVIKNNKQFEKKKTAKDFAEEFPNLVNTPEKAATKENISSKIFNKLSSQVDYVKEILNLLKSKITPQSNKLMTPSMNILKNGLNPDLNTEEGKATMTFTKNMINNIASMTHSGIPHYDKGGYIDEAQVATVGKGEVILSKDNVDKTVEALNDVLNSLTDKKGKKKPKQIATNLYNNLKKTDIEADSIEDYNNIFKNIVNSNKELKERIDKLGKVNELLYGKIKQSVSSNLYKDSHITEDLSNEELESRPFVEQAGRELVRGVKVSKDALFGTTPEDQKKSFGKVIDDVSMNISRYAPEAIGSSLLGAGVAMLPGVIGGPLLGAAVGAGISLTKNSEKMQNWLFGEKDENDKRQGGVIGKSTLDKMNKYLPDLKTYGIAGGVTGLVPFLPFGPIGGLMMGSAFAYAKNNDDIQRRLFGEEGLFKPESKQKLKKALPRMAGGAAVGMLAGPFGLVGNAVMGSGIGFLSTTDKFKELVLGKYNEKTKEYEGGIFPTIRETIILPMKESMGGLKDKLFGFIDRNVIKPISGAIDPLVKQMELFGKGLLSIPNKLLKKFTNSKFGVPFTKWLERKVIMPTKNVAKVATKVALAPIKGAIALPGRTIGAVGTHFRKKQIQQGNADYMTAEERLKYRDEHLMFGFDKYRKDDETLASLSDDDREDIYENMKYLKNVRKGMSNKRQDSLKEMGREVANNIYDYKGNKTIMKAVKEGDFETVKKQLGKSKYNLSKDKQEELLNSLSNKYKDYSSYEYNEDNAQNVRNELYKKLNKKGFKNMKDKNIDKYLSMLETERSAASKKKAAEEAAKTPEDKVIEVETKNHTEIVDLFNEAISLLKGIKDPDRLEREVGSAVKENPIESKPRTEIEKVINKAKNDSISTDDRKIETDDKGNVVEYVKNQYGEWVADKGDSSTLKAIKDAEQESNDKKNFMEQMLSKKTVVEGNGEGNKKEENEGLFSRLLGKGKSLLSGLFGRKAFGGANLGLLGGLSKFFLGYQALKHAPELIGIFKEGWNSTVKPFITEEAVPWIKNEGIPTVTEGIRTLLPEIGNLISSGVKFGFTEVIPTLAKSIGSGVVNGVGSLIGIGDENDQTSIAQRSGKAITRNIVTGGATGKMLHIGKVAAEETAEEATKNPGVFKTVAKGAKKVKDAVLHPFKTVTKGGVKLAKESVNGIGKYTAKAANFVSDKYNKVDEMIKFGNKGSLKSIGENIGTKLNNKLGIAKEVGDAGIKNLATDDGFIAKMVKNVEKFLCEILSNNKVTSLIGGDKAKKLLEKFVPSVTKTLSEGLTKQGAKVSAKLAGAISTGGLLNVAFAIGDFISGFNHSQSILGISEEPTFGAKVGAGLIKALNGLFIITSFIPERVWVNLICDTVLPIFGEEDNKLQQMREDTRKAAEQYNEENDSNLSVEEYVSKIEKDKPSFISRTIDKTKSWASKIGDKISNFFTKKSSKKGKSKSALDSVYANDNARKSKGAGFGGATPLRKIKKDHNQLVIPKPKIPQAITKKYGIGGQIENKLVRQKLKTKEWGIGGSRPSAKEFETKKLTEYPQMTAAQMKSWIASQSPDSPFLDDPQAFIDASKASGLDPRYILAHAAQESGWGKADMSHNYFGIGAYNDNPSNGHAYGNSSMRSGIIEGAKWIRKNFVDAGQDSLYGMIYNDPNHRYAVYDDGSPNVGWMQNIASIMSTAPYDGEIVKGTIDGSVSSSSGEEVKEDKPSIFSLFDDLENATGRALNRLYGFENPSESESSGGGSIGDGSSGAASGSATDWFNSKMGAQVTSPYGPRDFNGGEFHHGIDFGAPEGTEIPTPVGGTVKMVQSPGESGGFGNLAVIEDSNGMDHHFGHMQGMSPLRVGQKVKPGDIVGRLGNTGQSTGPHLHYEVRDYEAGDGNMGRTNPGLDALNPDTYMGKFFKSSNGSSKATTRAIADSREMGIGGPEEDTPTKIELPSSFNEGFRELVKSSVDSGNGKQELTKNTNSLMGNVNANLLNIVIKLLSKICDNTNNLTEIVKILSENSNVEIPKEIIEKTNKNQAVNPANLAKLLQSKNNNGDAMDNESLLTILTMIASE